MAIAGHCGHNDIMGEERVSRCDSCLQYRPRREGEGWSRVVRDKLAESCDGDGDGCQSNGGHDDDGGIQ